MAQEARVIKVHKDGSLVVHATDHDGDGVAAMTFSVTNAVETGSDTADFPADNSPDAEKLVVDGEVGWSDLDPRILGSVVLFKVAVACADLVPERIVFGGGRFRRVWSTAGGAQGRP